MGRGKVFPGGSPNVVLAGPGEAAGLPQRAWHLSDWPSALANREGVALAAGWEDFQEPTVNHQWFAPAQGHGATWQGYNAGPRRFMLPVTMHATRDRAFEVVREQFFEDLGHETPARLYVNSPTGTVWLDIRMDDEPPVLGDTRHSEVLGQEQDYLIPVVSEQSHWQGLEVARTWVDGQGWDNAELWNFGDLPEWPVWTLRGPGVFTIPDIAPTHLEGLEGFVISLLPDWLVDLLRQGGLVRDGQTTIVLLPGETMVLTGNPNRRLAVSDKRPNAHRLFGGQRPLFQVLPHRRWNVDGLRVVGGEPGVTSAVVQIELRRRNPW